MGKSLTAKQERFCQEYLIDLNATQAAIRAGYSSKSAQVIGSENLSKPMVASRIAELKTGRAEALGIEASWVLERLYRESEADLADLFYSETGALKPIEEWPLIWRMGLISGFDVVTTVDEAGNETGSVAKLRFSDRIRRIELVGKHAEVQAFGELRGIDSSPLSKLSNEELLDALGSFLEAS